MIVREKHKTDFTVIGNRAMNDDRLTPEALGVLCYLLSRPDNWEVYPAQLSKRFRGCGRDKTYRILNELIECGYVTRTALAAGGVDYRVVEAPGQANDKTPLPEKAEAPLPENPQPLPEKPDEPLPGKPLPEKPDAIIRTDSNQELTLEGIRAREGRLSETEAGRFFDERFWPTFPKRDGSNPKKPARDKFIRIVVNGENPEAILAGAERLAQDLRRQGKLGSVYVPQCITWLNQHRWGDDPAPRGPRHRDQNRPQSFFDVAMNELNGGDDERH